MDHRPPDEWREVAWNQVGFQAPKDWEIGAMGLRYLMLEDQAGPVLELKWGRIKGAFSPRRQLRRLSAQFGRRFGPELKGAALPRGWAEALSGFEVRGFAWRGKDVGGQGVLVFCPQCRLAALIQFYRRTNPGRTPGRLLASYRDHREDGTAFALYDLKAMVPAFFELKRYKFEPGRFVLSFTARGLRLSLYRWGPASVILGRRDLAGLTAEMTAAVMSGPREKEISGRKVMEWTAGPGPGPAAKWWGRLRGRPAFRTLRLWHLIDKNRILGLSLEGNRPPDYELLDRLTAGYESL